jgi:hypothetical protein
MTPEENGANAYLLADAPTLLAAVRALQSENDRLVTSLRWALNYGTFDVAEDNALHAAAMDRAWSLVGYVDP